jgi:hypothetical protein
MYQQERMSSNRAPLFKGDNYAFWSIRMRSYLMEIGCGVWIFVINNYDVPKTAPWECLLKIS